MFEEIYDVKKFFKVRCYLFEFYEVKKKFGLVKMFILK